jgi:hypothetical protein
MESKLMIANYIIDSCVPNFCLGTHKVNVSRDQKWVKFFYKASIPNLQKIAEFVLSIPVGNAVVEPISNNENLDTDKRNSLQFKTAEI